MRKSYSFLTVWLMACLVSINAYAQPVTISGNVKNSVSKENVPAVSIRVKGTDRGTYSNSDGDYTLNVPKLPVVLIFSSIGYEAQEVTVSDASKAIDISFVVNSSLAQEVVVAATRAPIRLLESPVTVERMSNAVIKNVAAPSVYEALTNLKGVDVHTASLTFRTVTTRGFVSSGNLRLNQLVDGMDNQAPGLNFSVSSIVGLTDLDVDNIEVLSGASSALYGSGGMNGTVLITSKNPFKYTGFSYNVKQGIMHVDGKQRSASPYNNVSMRWAKSFKDKVALRISGELIRGNDWQADDYRNKQQIGVLSSVVGGNRNNDPNFNGVNIYGDETSVNIGQLAALLSSTINANVAAQSGGLVQLQAAANNYFTAIGNPTYPTNAQVAGYVNLFAPAGAAAQQAAQLYAPMYIGLRNNYFGNSNNVTRTGYEEKSLVDYNTLNVKMNIGVHWKINDRIEASVNSYIGSGTTVYTGANRYSLRNFKMAQHKLEVKAKNWMVRGYTTQENSGDSYIGDAVGSFVNESYRLSVNTSSLAAIPTSWFPLYLITFSEGRRQLGTTVSDITLHNNARASADVGRFLPGTPQFNAAAASIKKIAVNKPGGSKFLDKSDLFASEAQINLSDAAHFSDKVEVIIGTSWKQWIMNSQGTIFADTAQPIRINEYGGYAQLKKKLFNDVLTLIVSGRYDKQTNYEGKFTPRYAAVIKVAKENNLRLSYQTSYRFPSNQNQYISLRIGGGSTFLIGCLPEFQSYFKLNSSNPGYTAASILAYRAGAPGDSSRLVVAPYKDVKPETVKSYEIGYKGVLAKQFLVDAYFYYSKYENFLLSPAVGQSQTGNKLGNYSPFSTNNYSYVQNSDQTVKSIGWGFGLEYKVIKNYVLYGNVFSDVLKDVPDGAITFFNAPKYRFNIGLRNDNVYKNIGFNVVFKWQDNNYYEGTFVSGTLPYFGWWDGQITYRPQGTKSTFRVGGTNIGNNYQRTGFGSPAVGGLYYISYGWNLY
jgi:outer membrane receptor protein involved in Fe transport